MDIASQIAANRIVLRRVAGVWVAQYIGPHADEIKVAFGSDTVPTAFVASALAGTVYNQIQATHPDASIGVASSEFGPWTRLSYGDTVWMKRPDQH